MREIAPFIAAIITAIATDMLHQLSALDKLIVAVVLALKAYFLWALPITGDEIYWIWWGRELAAGYYDHPPLVGWLLGLMSYVSDAMPWYRSVALITCLVVTVAMYKMLVMRSAHLATGSLYTSLAFLVSPVSLIVLMTANNTVLLLTAFLGLYCLMRAIHTSSTAWGWAAGVCFGLAFLSKYFAVFLFAGLAIYAIRYRNMIRLSLLASVAIPVVAAIAQNLYYNASTCWNNILFNFFSRTASSAFHPEGLPVFLLVIAALLTPWGLIWIARPSLWAGWRRSWAEDLPLYAGLPLLLALAVVSAFQIIGVHWPLMAMPMLWMAYARLPQARAKTFFRVNGVVSIAIALAAVIAVGHLEKWLPENKRAAAAFFLHVKEVCPTLGKEPVLLTSYSGVALVSWACARNDVHLFASTSKYGREDDHRTNFREFSGKTLQVILPETKKLEAIRPFFKEVLIEPFSLAPGVTHYKVIGKGFDDELYRDHVLRIISDTYYTPPAWFPPGQCSFKQKYDLNRSD